ncbi:MAG: hypothetical protein ACKVX7_09600 [Planctomycetota bacterium]
MAHLFVNLASLAPRHAAARAQWAISELEGPAECWLADDVERPVRRDARDTRGAHLLRRAGREDEWLVIAALQAAPVHVNGRPLAAQLAVLRDRDEIRLAAGAQFLFSTERLARVQPYPGAPRPAHCPRCRQPVNAGQPSVACPQCGLWHHEDAPTLACWSYSPASACVCHFPTAADGYRFTPESVGL